MFCIQVELLLNFEELFPSTISDLNEEKKRDKSEKYQILEWLWKITSGETKEVKHLQLPGRN